MQKSVSILHDLQTLRRKNFGIRQKLPGRFVKIAFYTSSGKIRENTFADKIKYFFDFWQKTFEALLSKPYSERPEEIFEESIISVKILFFYHFRTFGENLSAFCLKLPERVVKNASYLSRKISGRTVFLTSSLFHLVPIVGKKIKLFVEKTSAVLSKLPSTYALYLF